MLDNFKISTPKVNRPIKISIYLPDNYDNTNDYYDVLYLLDGQNAFYDKDSLGGRSLRISQYLEMMSNDYQKKIIAVGIHSSLDELERKNEYTPFSSKNKGPNNGEEFYNFFITEIKPFIEKRYRCFNKPQNTIVYGANEGALMSLYLAFNNSIFFGSVGIFNIDNVDVEKELLCFLRSKFDPNIKVFIVDSDKENTSKKIENQLKMFGCKDLYFSINDINNEAGFEKHILDFLKFVYDIN